MSFDSTGQLPALDALIDVLATVHDGDAVEEPQNVKIADTV
jgi:hypothetical protein